MNTRMIEGGIASEFQGEKKVNTKTGKKVQVAVCMTHVCMHYATGALTQTGFYLNPEGPL